MYAAWEREVSSEWQVWHDSIFVLVVVEGMVRLIGWLASTVGERHEWYCLAANIYSIQHTGQRSPSQKWRSALCALLWSPA
jgi:hypothetical protein